ncbi:hypothetical protein NDU88_000668 [Pleurodeles waltl]|uniref:Uncharacterized protein n=1 Tax=Pleurodeles waltl TaxID=8319 RepID=A0AAV7V5N9_PLEWA|nr:hypothetical protein NDU88_000668 [Pleurodeles waltl]
MLLLPLAPVMSGRERSRILLPRLHPCSPGDSQSEASGGSSRTSAGEGFSGRFKGTACLAGSVLGQSGPSRHPGSVPLAGHQGGINARLCTGHICEQPPIHRSMPAITLHRTAPLWAHMGPGEEAVRPRSNNVTIVGRRD